MDDELEECKHEYQGDASGHDKRICIHCGYRQTWENVVEAIYDPAIHVIVSTEQVNQLMEKLKDYESDIISLVTVFQSFSGLFSGKSNMITIGAAVMKIINDPKQAEKFQHIIPIIEKYTKP